MVLVNGEKVDAQGLTVLECLERMKKNPTHVAVMINGEILPKTQYADSVIEDGNEVDIIGFVGGG